jgi:hypothetical protein
VPGTWDLGGEWPSGDCPSVCKGGYGVGLTRVVGG